MLSSSSSSSSSSLSSSSWSAKRQTVSLLSSLLSLVIILVTFLSLYLLANYEIEDIRRTVAKRVLMLPTPIEEASEIDLNSEITGFEKYLEEVVHCIELYSGESGGNKSTMTQGEEDEVCIPCNIDVARETLYAIAVRGYAFLGYALSLSTEDLTTKNMTVAVWRNIWSKDVSRTQSIVNYLDKAILYFSQMDTLDRNQRDFRNIMYFAHFYKANKLVKINRLQDALLSARKTIEFSSIDYQKAHAFCLEGDIHMLLGTISASVESYQAALVLKPSDLTIHLKLVRCHTFLKELNRKDWQTYFDDIERKYKSGPIHVAPLRINYLKGKYFASLPKSPLVRSGSLIGLEYSKDHSMPIFPPYEESITHALFESAENSDQFKKAWFYLHKRNLARFETLKKMPNFQVDFELNAIQDLANVVKRTFKRGYWPDERLDIGSNSKVPIFIVGMVRSGSTLLESMLSAHPNITTVEEDDSFSVHVKELLDRGIGNQVASNFESSPNLQEFLRSTAETQLLMMRQKAEVLYERIPEEYSLDKPPIHIVDKMLNNYLCIGFIHLLFPNALIIHTVRDPIDTLISAFRTNFNHPLLYWTLSLDMLKKAYVIYFDVMRHYNAVLPNRIYSAQYESLVQDPEKILREICKKLQIPFDPIMLRFETSNRTAHTSSMLQVKKKLYKESVGSWRRYSKMLKEFSTDVMNTVLDL